MLNCKEQSFSFYTQVKNPSPCFTPPEGKNTLPFCRKLMEKAVGFTDNFAFSMHMAFSRATGKRHRQPPRLRRTAINALMQALLFHYDPLGNRVNASITTMAIECGLATESENGNLSITRATRALASLAKDTGLITYETTFDPEIGCNVPSDIQFTPALFEMLDISPEALASERNSRAEWENQKREKQGLPRLSLDELASKAFSYVRNAFRAYHRKRRLHGLKRLRAKRDAELSRKDIERKVKAELQKEIGAGTFPADLAVVLREVASRVKERMIMSRGNHTRLATP